MTNSVSDKKASTVTADSIANFAQKAAKKGPPPVHLWNPDFCGDLDMRIARDGTWFYLGTPIGRKPLVKLFSSIIRKDGDKYFLVTPVEKVGIIVDDAPFVAVDFDVTGAGADQVITFTTNVDDEVPVSADNPIRVELDPTTGEPSPYVERKSFYRLVDIGVTEHHQGADWFGVRSSGAFFPIIPASELP